MSFNTKIKNKLQAQASLPSFLIITLLILIVISTLGYVGISEILSAEREKNISYDWSLIQTAINEALIRLARNKDLVKFDSHHFDLSLSFGQASTTIFASSSNIIIEIEAKPQGIFSLKKRARAVLNIDSYGVIKFLDFKEL